MMPIAPEGWPFLVPAWALVALGAWAIATVSPWVWAGEAPLLLVAVWLIVFFRNPRRQGPRGDQWLVAPADGIIVEIAVVQEPMYLRGEATRISTFMNVFDVHVNRYPVSGAVELVHHNPGKFLHAASEKASLENEQASVGIRGPRGGVLVRQIAGLVARRIVTDGHAGERAVQGERLGMIRFGSRVDLFIPQTNAYHVLVTLDERIRSKTSMLGDYTWW
jgi:phosphatidylserine decarboxylase